MEEKDVHSSIEWIEFPIFFRFGTNSKEENWNLIPSKKSLNEYLRELSAIVRDFLLHSVLVNVSNGGYQDGWRW